jgi:uncharacterized protein (TIGR04141 family)
MSDPTQPKSIALSVRLLREGYSVDDSLRRDCQLEEIAADGGRLFIGQSPPTAPTWMSFINQFTAATADLRLRNQSCAAVLLIEIDDVDKSIGVRTMAITFGTGHHALNPDAFERGFGLRVVLNAVARSSLRSLDIATLDATTFLRRVQASRDADLGGFGIDIDRDLLRLAAGSPKDPTFAKSLAGRDALAINCKISPADLLNKCRQALNLYNASDYKKDFAFIDYICPVKDRALLDQLDELAFAELCALVDGDPSDLHISLPDVIDPEEGIEIGYYGLGLKSGTKTAHTQLAIEDYVSELRAGRMNEILDMATLRASHEVRVIVDGEGDKKRKRKTYDCFVLEVEVDGSVFVLFGGEWFAVEKNFHALVERDFRELISAAPFVASTFQTNEREFINELGSHQHLLNLDQVKLNPKNMPGASLEPCDFLSMQRQLIHLKDGHDSAPISHLWNQGMVSAEAFVRDEKYRKDFRTAVKHRQSQAGKSGFEKLLPDGRSKSNPSEFTVVFGIMRSRYIKSGVLDIPFFSKISLRAAVDRIRLMGFNVEVHLVEKIARIGKEASVADAA